MTKEELLNLIETDLDIREAIFQSVVQSSSFASYVGEAYRDDEYNRLKEESRCWV